MHYYVKDTKSPYTRGLYVLFFIVLIIFLFMVFWTIDYTCVENFGSNCVDFISYSSHKNIPIRPGTIFVSVASYRDEECSMTLNSMFSQAENPSRIFVGICEQNKEGQEKETCISPQIASVYGKNIRIKKMNYQEAKGPTFARYWCSQLWNGEQYYLQIDSHTTFEKDWDSKLIKMIQQCKQESKRPVLSVYPPSKDQSDIKGVPEFDNGKLNDNNLPTFLCGWTSESESPKRSNKPWAAAGLMFLESDFLKHVPFDPNLSHLFQSEEGLFSARLFTNGYDFYTPNKCVCYHNYSRSKSPLYWKDIPKHTECRTKAEKRAMFLLGIGNKNSIANDFMRDLHKYGMGKYRTIKDWWNASGVDFDKKHIEKWNDSNYPSKKFQGWWFRKDGYNKIKKF